MQAKRRFAQTERRFDLSNQSYSFRISNIATRQKTKRMTKTKKASAPIPIINKWSSIIE